MGNTFLGLLIQYFPLVADLALDNVTMLGTFLESNWASYQLLHIWTIATLISTLKDFTIKIKHIL